MRRFFTVPTMAELAATLDVAIHDSTPPREVYFSRADCWLHGFDWGGAGLPVLLLHGERLSARTWDFVCLGLRDEVRLVALDLRGHGDSDWSDDYRIDAMAADVIAAADHLGFARFGLVGMSLGGVVAARAACWWPDRVSRLALIEIAPGLAFGSARGMRRFMRRLAPVDDLDAVVQAAIRIDPHVRRATVAYRVNTLFRPTGEGCWVPKADPLAPAFATVVAGVDRLPTPLVVPTLLVRGARSTVLSQATAQHLACRISHANLAVVPDAGHYVQEDNPAALTTALRGFLSDASTIDPPTVSEPQGHDLAVDGPS